MIPLLKIPQIVQHYAPYLRRVFSAAAFRHFQRYVGGLMVSENETIEGINRLFVQDPRSQSSLNRYLTRSRFSREALNEARLLMLQEQPETRIKPAGVLSLDDTLLSHYGRCFEKIAWLFDPSTQAYTWAHNLVGLHYSDEQSDYPIDLRLWGLQWHAGGITGIAGRRWPIEVYHEEAKAEGLDRYQIRGFTAIDRHIALVTVVYSMLRRAQHDRILWERLSGFKVNSRVSSRAAWRRNGRDRGSGTAARGSPERTPQSSGCARLRRKPPERHRSSHRFTT